jgi:hypothetical protein
MARGRRGRLEPAADPSSVQRLHGYLLAIGYRLLAIFVVPAAAKQRAKSRPGSRMLANRGLYRRNFEVS